MSEPVVPIQETVVDKKELDFRKQREHYEYEMSKQAKLIAEQQELLQKSQTKPEEEDDDEPYVDKKKLKKVLNSFEADMEKKIDMMAEKKANSLLEQERTANYLQANSDFDKVMQSDLVQKFADTHPSLAKSILRMPDSFERQKLVYENIKALKLDAPVSKIPSAQEKIDANRRNPGYQPNSVGSAPYEGAADFSPQGMLNAYERTKALIKNRKG